MIFDSHAHLVCADQVAYPPKPLRGELTPGEFDDPMTVEKLVAQMDRHGVVCACAVQRAHVYGYDNSYTLDSVTRFPDRLRAVVVLDPLDPETPSLMRQLVSERGIAGVRFSARDLGGQAIDWLAAPEAAAAWCAAADLALPICIHVLHVQRDFVLPALAVRIMEFPEVTVVVDHVGGAHAAVVEQRWLAAQGKEPGGEYPAAMMRLADLPNAVMKLSDINLEGAADPAAFVARIVSTFGAERLIWGSDIGQSRGEYGHMVAMALDAVAPLPPAAREAILHDNAARIYGARGM